MEALPMNSEHGLGTMGCKMKTVFFLGSIVAVTVYLIAAAIEDYKTCQVTRWKHFIGFIPAFLWFVINIRQFLIVEFTIILAFLLTFIGIGYEGIYGLADGFVLANLSLLFGGTGGAAGIGMVILIMLVASFSFFICHVWSRFIKKESIFKNAAGPLIPHITVGYIITMLGLVCRTAI